MQVGAQTGVRNAAGSEVEVAIAIVVAPGQIAGFEAGQIEQGVGELAFFICVDAELSGTLGAGAGGGEVEVAVVVVITPEHFAIVEPDELLVGLEDYKIVVSKTVVLNDEAIGLLTAVDYVITLPHNGEVEVAVVVVVAPIRGAFG